MSDPTGTEHRHIPRWVVVAATVLSVAVMAITVLLLLAGPEWEWIATVLAIPISTALAIVGLLVGHRTAPAKPLSRRTKLSILVLLIVTVAAPFGGKYYYDNLTDLDADLGPSFELRRDAVKAVPVTVEKPRWHGELTFTARLSPLGELGDCVLTGHLAITPIVAGERLDELRVEHQGTASIAVPPHTGELTLEVRYINQMQYDCAVSAKFAEGKVVRW